MMDAIKKHKNVTKHLERLKNLASHFKDSLAFPKCGYILGCAKLDFRDVKG